MLTVFSHCTRSLGKALIQPSRCTHRAPLRQTTKTMECLWGVPAVTDLLGAPGVDTGHRFPSTSDSLTNWNTSRHGGER